MIPVVEWHNGMDLVVIIYFTDLNMIYVQHLLQETEAKKKKLVSANRTKLALLAEVKYDSSSVLGLSLHADSTATFQLRDCVNWFMLQGSCEGSTDPLPRAIRRRHITS